MEISAPESRSSFGQPMVDGVKSDSGANSPTSSTGAGSRPHQKQVQISRNTGTGYERPERARTSHACEPCRERKTKCDGERPSCRRCLHTGTSCHYGYGKGWKKRKTAEDLTVTSRKLARYEELLNDIFPLVSPDVRNMIEAARQEEFPSLSVSDLADSSTPSLNSYDSGDKSNSPSANRLPLPMSVGITPTGPHFAGTSRSLVPPLSLERSHSPLSPGSALRKASMSPSDDSGVGGIALRLPSITRQGFLVEDALRAQLKQGPSSGSAEALRPNEPSITRIERDTTTGASSSLPPG